MEKCRSDIAAIVVGSARQKLVRSITAYLDRKDIHFEECEDIYSAVATIAAAPAGLNLLVIGEFTSLTSENMRLFSLETNGKRIVFCGLLEKCFTYMQNRLAAAIKSGVFVINSTEQIEDVIKQCQNSAPSVRQKTGGRDFASRIATLADNFFLTQAEHDALLGVEQNADAEL